MLVAPGEEIREHRSADGMVGTAQGARHHAKHRLGILRHVFGIGKESHGKHRCHTGILHSDLDGDGPFFCCIELEKLTHAVAKHIAERIVTEHHCKYQENQAKTVRKQLRTHRHDDATHNHHEANHAHRGHIRLDFLEHGTLAKEIVAEEPDRDRRNRYIKNVQEHSLRIHVDARIGKPQHKQRSHDRRKERRDHRHAHGVRDIATGQEAHDVARDTARTAPHQDDTHGKVGIEPENLREAECNKRHDRVLCNRTEQNVKRLLHQVTNVVYRNGKAHTQHDDAENDGGYIPVNPAESDGHEECDYCACDDKGGSVVRKQTAESLDYFKHISNIAIHSRI